jgi:hypothetical protein
MKYILMMHNKWSTIQVDTPVPSYRSNHKEIDINVRTVGRRQAHAKLVDLVVSMPAQYTKTPLLGSEEQ